MSTIGAAIQGKGKLYRYGGDEFCVLLRNYSTAEGHMTAERIRAAIDAKPPVRGSVKVTTSIGVASSEMQGLEDPQKLVDSADKAMYVAKGTTKNRVCAWEQDKNQPNSAGR